MSQRPPGAAILDFPLSSTQTDRQLTTTTYVSVIREGMFSEPHTTSTSKQHLFWISVTLFRIGLRLR